MTTHDRAERDTLIGVEVPDPEGGEPYRFRPLPFKRARHWWEQLVVAQAQGYGGLLDPDAMTEFAAEVETVDGTSLEDLPFNPAEVMYIAQRFLAHIRPGWSPWPGETKNPTTEAEAPPSSTS